MSSTSNKNHSKKFSEYYLGLDIGTNSVGWCVTDPQYNVLKFNGKSMWGVRLFDAAVPAAQRRAFRTSRRRLHRRNQRISMVQDLMAEEILKEDPNFFIRLRESRFLPEDKNERLKSKFNLFADDDFTDKDYYKKYPTIYHLRWALIQHKENYDIRLYYLAISHIMKHRGHFLFDGKIADATSFDKVFSDLNEYIERNYEFSLRADDMNAFKTILLNRNIGRMDKKKELKELYTRSGNKAVDKMRETALAALVGNKVKLSDLYEDETFKNFEVPSFSFADGIDENNEMQLSNDLADDFEYIIKLKAVYDWTVLTDILSGCSSISEAQVKTFEKHKKDLEDLKYAVRKYIPDSYDEIFSSDKVENNYAAYVSHASEKNGVVAKSRKYTGNDFCNYIKGKFNGINTDDPVVQRIKNEAENYTFMPKQKTKSNSSVPHQVHEKDLKIILKNLGEDYPEFAEKEDDGYSKCEKILKIFQFRIPYYVGPLNPYHSVAAGGHSWVVRKKSGKVYPWNFEDKVDLEKSAEAFIKNLTNECTYLIHEDVLPKDSLLYSRYMVLNELNNVKVTGTKLPVNIKQRIYNEIFKKRREKYSLEKLKNWLIKENIADKDALISGIDDTFKASLKSYQDFYKIIGSRVDTEPLMVEDIIENILIFGQDKEMLRKRIAEKYSEILSEDEIRDVSRLSYTGWGRFSRKLLNGITEVNHSTGETLTIIEAMWNGQENFMELMSSKHEYMRKIQECNEKETGKSEQLTYDLVRESYASPVVKRGIWQALRIVSELQKITGNDPSRIFVEVARSKEKNPKRKSSRKTRLIERYKSIEDSRNWFSEIDSHRNWISEIDSHEDRDFQNKKLYLYYTQMGRDMYSGEPIEDLELFTNEYNKDHIYPQSKTKDDSVLNNLVLTRVEENNNDKQDIYPVPEKLRQPELWKYLVGVKLITKEKYYRLTRKVPLTAEELASFISRQIVETRQSTKVAAQILKQVMPSTKIVYLKAEAVSRFRQENDFVKARIVNDYHHAKDAYLNIVVGNVYYTKFTDNPINFIENAGRSGKTYSLNHIFDYDVSRNGKTAWKKGNDGTIAAVRKQMLRNNILFTRYAIEKRGGFFDQMPLRKGSGQLIPFKMSDKRFDTDKYGGYYKAGINYFMLVESDDRKGRKRTLEGVPVYLSGASNAELIEFCEKTLNLRNPDIRIPEIKINSLLKLDGYPMHISGKTGDHITMKNAVQLCLASEQEKIIHNIERVVEKHKENNNYMPDMHDGVDDEKLIEIYDCLLSKSKTNIYRKKLSSQIDKLEKGREKFLPLPLIEKCSMIIEIMHLFQCKNISVNLTSIGGKANAGKFKKNKKISNCENARLINQSVTGLFEQERDLLKI